MMKKGAVSSKSLEARSWVESLREVRKKIREAKGKLKSRSVFTDYIFQPRGENWNLDEKNLKLRVWEKGENAGLIELKYYPAKWFKGIKGERAALSSILFDKKEAFSILDDWNFENLFSFSRQREVWEVKDLLVYLENIDLLGKMVEVEGDREKEIEEMFTELGLGKRVAHSVPYLLSRNFKEKKKAVRHD